MEAGSQSGGESSVACMLSKVCLRYIRRMIWLAAERRQLFADRNHGYEEGARFTLCGLPVAALTPSPGTAFPNDDETGFLCRDCVAETRP